MHILLTILVSLLALTAACSDSGLKDRAQDLEEHAQELEPLQKVQPVDYLAQVTAVVTLCGTPSGGERFVNFRVTNAADRPLEVTVLLFGESPAGEASSSPRTWTQVVQPDRYAHTHHPPPPMFLYVPGIPEGWSCTATVVEAAPDF